MIRLWDLLRRGDTILIGHLELEVITHLSKWDWVNLKKTVKLIMVDCNICPNSLPMLLCPCPLSYDLITPLSNQVESGVDSISSLLDLELAMWLAVVNRMNLKKHVLLVSRGLKKPVCFYFLALSCLPSMWKHAPVWEWCGGGLSHPSHPSWSHLRSVDSQICPDVLVFYCHCNQLLWF